MEIQIKRDKECELKFKAYQSVLKLLPFFVPFNIINYDARHGLLWYDKGLRIVWLMD